MNVSRLEIEQMIDNYTKVILTVIAVSTSFIAVKDSGLISSATAEGDHITKVAICSYANSNFCAEIEAHPIKGNVLKTSDIRRSD
jgi:hypothetical protein